MFALFTSPVDALAQRGNDLVNVAVVVFRWAWIKLGEPVEGLFVYFFRIRRWRRSISGGGGRLRWWSFCAATSCRALALLVVVVVIFLFLFLNTTTITRTSSLYHGFRA
jgi:hypothetical protein